MTVDKSSGPLNRVFARIVICLVILATGIGGMMALAALKKPPAEIKAQERAIRVTAVEAVPESVQVYITGHGQVQPVDVVTISSEVAGKVTALHEDLEVGMTVAKGDLLFAVDPVNYRAGLDNARASVRLWENTRQRLNRQKEMDAARLVTLERNRDLAEAEFERLRRLFEEDRVGTRSGVDAAERQFNATADQADQIAKAVAISPIQIREAENSLAAARAQMEKAEADLNRCRVLAPFDGRIKAVAVEKGQYITPGLAAVTLADDSVLEIEVPLDSRELRRWLRFTKDPLLAGGAWFNRIEPVDCLISWTEDSPAHTWTGRLDRVVRFDPDTRTVTVAVRISADEAAPGKEGILPLVEGMFCRVRIPGLPLDNVIRLPRWAVSYQNTVYIANGDRLKTVPVEVAHIQNDQVLISGGLAAGDRVITTRLVDPLENSLLKVDIP